MEINPSLTPTYLAGKLDEYVKQAGRDTIMNNVARDRHARYARIPDGRACDFCKMLGSRGFVYHSEYKAGGGGNNYHPHCNCQIALSFEPEMQYYWKNGVQVSRGFDDDAVLVKPGRDGSYEKRAYDPDELFAEYQALGRRFKAGSKHKVYTRGAKLTDEQFNAFMQRLSDAKTLDELHAVGDDILKEWTPNENGRYSAQWDEMSRHAQALEKEMQSKHDSVSGVSAAIDPEVKSWARQFPNEKLWVYREDGELFFREGSPTGVKTTDAEDASFRNGKAKHTHTTSIGGTFGEDDIWFTTENWLSEHEVEDTYHGITYRLVRNADASEESVEKFARAYEEESFRNYDRILGEIYDANGGEEAHLHGATLEEKLEAEMRLKPIQHEWLTNNAGSWGYDYYQAT